MTDLNINAARFAHADSIPLAPSPPASQPCPPTKAPHSTPFIKQVVWSILPMALWFLAANGLAYYFTTRQNWANVNQEAVVFYSFVTLYAVPWVMTIITGFMSWGYALSVYGFAKGTLRAFGIFALQWLAIWAMAQASIHWHYVYFYTEQVYF